MSEAQAVRHVLSRHLEKFYRREQIQVEPPKGAYSFIAVCGMSDTILGPPNYHDYQTRLRKLHAERFSIGSHTVNHIDCAHEAEDVVRQELADAITDLRRELGLQEVILAYPYGGRQHMTAQRLELVKQAGYRGCLSAYGGVNVAKVDPYNILRTGGHYEFSDMAFRYVCLGLQ